MSKTKEEQIAITKFRDLVDEIDFFKHDFSEDDKGISWDGFINMYNGDVDKKVNFDYAIDVQIKGRTSPNKKLKSKCRFSLERVDLENYLKKDGTLLLLYSNKKDSNEYKLYYAELLPYNIRLLLKQFSTGRIKIDMKEILSPQHFELVCRNFKIDKEMQKRINSKIFDKDNLTLSQDKEAKFYLWDKNVENFEPQKLIGAWKYIYTLDENGYTIGISYGEFTNLVSNLDMIISSKSKSIVYSNVIRETTKDDDKIKFGKAFYFDLKVKTFNIKICGSLKERVEELRFIKEMYKNKFFYINKEKFIIEDNISNKAMFEDLLMRYKRIFEFFKNHNISKDIDFDEWTNNDLNRLYLWITTIEDKKEIKLNSDKSIVGSISIKDLRISIFARIDKNNMFKVDSIWNSEIANKYEYRYDFIDHVITTNNTFLVLNYEAYMSEDINIKEMKEVFEKVKLSEDEYTLLNFQLLEVLSAYDKNNNEELLKYAEYLSDKLILHDSNDVYFKINYYQTKKRKGKLNEKYKAEIEKILNSNESVEIKLACNILLDNKKETKLLSKKLKPEVLNIFKEYPIAVFML